MITVVYCKMKYKIQFPATKWYFGSAYLLNIETLIILQHGT